MADALNGALSALAALSATPLDHDNQAAAAAAIFTLRQAARDIESLPSRRPFVQDLQSRQAAARSLVDMAELYLSTLEKSTPLDAQSAGKEAQAAIDAAIRSLDEADAQQERGNQFSAAVREDYYGGVLALLEDVRPGVGFMKADALERARLEAELGRPVHTGMGAEFVMRMFLATTWSDPVRMWESIKAASVLFAEDDVIREIASEPGALSLLADARDSVVESLFNFDVAISSATSDRDRLRRAIGVYRELFEDGAAPIFAWYLKVAGAKSAPIEKLMDKDSTDLLRSINARPELADLFLGADANIRNAASHGHKYRLDGEDVVITLRSHRETISVDVLVDLLMALIESLLASFWVLDNELGRLGYEEHNSGATVAGASRLPIAVALLQEQGARVIAAEEEDRHWTIEIARNGVDPFTMAYSMGVFLGPNLKSYVLVSPDLPMGEVAFDIEDARAFVGAHKGGPFAGVIAVLGLLQSVRVDGRPALSDDHLRRTAAMGAAALLAQGQLTGIALVRDVIRRARERGLRDVVGYCELLFEEWRAPEPLRRFEIDRTMVLWTQLPDPKPPIARRIRVEFVERQSSD